MILLAGNIQRKIRTNCCLLIFVLVSISVPVLYYFLVQTNQSKISGESNSINLLEVFAKLDSDNDGKLSFEEFFAIKKDYILSPNPDISPLEEVQVFPDLPIEPGGQIVNIKTLFKPLDVNSLSKELRVVLDEPMISLKGLLTWVKPYKEEHNFSAQSFSVFLPPWDTPHILGTTWWIVTASYEQLLTPTSGFKHLPPLVEERLRPLFALLSLFHPRPFLWTRFPPQGTIAILRAMGENFLDIVFRIHAEFQLNEAPLLPFWFTPAQFFGRLIVSKDGTTVHHFEMEVPSNRRLNVDMEWFNGPSDENMEVDIGYVPQMQLSSNISTTAQDVFLGLKENAHNGEVTEMSLELASEILLKSFFPFQKVKYYNFTDAFEEAASQSKLVHGILLWGSLDDQSC